MPPFSLISFIKDKFLSGKKPDKNLPALKGLVEKISVQDIFDEVESVLDKQLVMAVNAKMYLCYKYTEERLKDIETHFGIDDFRVSQATHRIKNKIEQDKKFKRKIAKIKDAKKKIVKNEDPLSFPRSRSRGPGRVLSGAARHLEQLMPPRTLSGLKQLRKYEVCFSFGLSS